MRTPAPAGVVGTGASTEGGATTAPAAGGVCGREGGAAPPADAGGGEEEEAAGFAAAAPRLPTPAAKLLEDMHAYVMTLTVLYQ